jgi:hypothetical protein
LGVRSEGEGEERDEVGSEIASPSAVQAGKESHSGITINPARTFRGACNVGSAFFALSAHLPTLTRCSCYMAGATILNPTGCPNPAAIFSKFN